MTLEELFAWVRTRLPDATLGQEIGGEIIIYTKLCESKKLVEYLPDINDNPFSEES